MDPDGVIEVRNRCGIWNFGKVGWFIPFIPLFFFFFNLQSNWNEIVDNFDDMNLKESLLRGIYAYGFEKPSAIQQRAIIPCIKGKRTC